MKTRNQVYMLKNRCRETDLLKGIKRFQFLISYVNISEYWQSDNQP